MWGIVKYFGLDHSYYLFYLFMDLLRHMLQSSSEGEVWHQSLFYSQVFHLSGCYYFMEYWYLCFIGISKKLNQILITKANCPHELVK
jgi:hypothetical protein